MVYGQTDAGFQVILLFLFRETNHLPIGHAHVNFLVMILALVRPVCPLSPSLHFVNVPLKDYIILFFFFAPFLPLVILSAEPFLPRDNWLIHRCITPPPPDPQFPSRTARLLCFYWCVWVVMASDITYRHDRITATLPANFHHTNYVIFTAR